MNRFFIFTLVIILASLFFSSCGTDISFTNESDEPLNLDQMYRLNIGSSSFETGCIQLNKDFWIDKKLSFDYQSEHSIYRSALSVYNQPGCQKEDMWLLAEDRMFLNIIEEGVESLLRLRGEEEKIVSAARGTYVHSEQMITLLDDALGFGRDALSSLKVDHPDYYPESLELGTKIDIAGKPFLYGHYDPNGIQHDVLVYLSDSFIAVTEDLPVDGELAKFEDIYYKAR